MCQAMKNTQHLAVGAPRGMPACDSGLATQKCAEQIEALTRVCVDDLLGAFGLGGLRRGRHLLELLCRVPARRVARQIAAYDEIVGESGLRMGGAWALERMVRRVEIEGRSVPPGSLLRFPITPGWLTPSPCSALSPGRTFAW
jgi:hypothetical protein